jgi:ATP-dependent DNA helicase PIF1
MRIKRLLNSENPNIEQGTRAEHFNNWLNDLATATINSELQHSEDDSTIFEFPENMLLPTKDRNNINNEDINNLIKWVYNDLQNNQQNPCNYYCDRAILSTTNSTIDLLNNQILEQIHGDIHVLYSADTVKEENQQTMITVEFLNSLTPSGLPPHELQLKTNSPIMLLRNFDQPNGHCNGTRYLIDKIHDKRIIEASIMTGEYKGNKLFIPRILLSPSETTLPFTMQRRQFPIRLCFALTINKSQGQTFKQVGVYLPNPVFSHGQLYVAASRVGDSNHTKFLIDQNPYMQYKKDKQIDLNKTYCTNIVYKNILKKLTAKK